MEEDNIEITSLDDAPKRGRGRPFGTYKQKKSRARVSLDEMYKREKKAYMILDEMMEIKDADLTPAARIRNDTAKFVIKTIESLNETCLREEAAILKVRDKNKETGDELEEAQSSEAVSSGNFSMDMPPQQH